MFGSKFGYCSKTQFYNSFKPLPETTPLNVIIYRSNDGFGTGVTVGPDFGCILFEAK